MFKRKREKGRENLATEIISDLMEKLAIYRVALIVSLIGNIVLAAALILR